MNGLRIWVPHPSPTFLEPSCGDGNFLVAILARKLDSVAEAFDAGTLPVGIHSDALVFHGLEAIASIYAVDISVDFLEDAIADVQRKHPLLDVAGVGLDFSSELQLPPDLVQGRPVFFYPGSSIGNFTPVQALQFLRQVRAAALGGGLLIGVDLVKPLEILEPAYDDALGVTAAFNKNLLLHLNRLIGSDFRVQDWAHRAFFNAGLSRIEMHLQAVREVTLRWPGAQRQFRAGEGIHTENSYKYRAPDFDALLRQAGFAQTRVWQDARGWFAVFWACD